MRCQVLRDRLDGTVTELVRREQTLSGEEARQATDDVLDAYINFVCRSAKRYRDGFPVTAHPDAAPGESDPGAPSA
ncbi:hypothetical protein [Streptomyces sp. NPDC048637]|uniref:hypothetical protein n=1 Tax=Streptomyces sp. NPDC048637 TaxID=3155636 RepID=UPI00341EA337